MGFKIVRDRHQETMQGIISGQWRISPNPAYALAKKVFEEAGEFIEQMDPAELYDLLDVAWELCRVMDPDGRYRADHERKKKLYGGFSRHLEWSPLPREHDAELETPPGAVREEGGQALPLLHAG